MFSITSFRHIPLLEVLIFLIFKHWWLPVAALTQDWWCDECVHLYVSSVGCSCGEVKCVRRNWNRWTTYWLLLISIGLLNQSYRLGGVKDYYGRWFWANYVEPNCMTPVTDTDWHSGQPDGECMVYETRGDRIAWRATTCSVNVYFACEKYC